jgi:hypothetical protein
MPSRGTARRRPQARRAARSPARPPARRADEHHANAGGRQAPSTDGKLIALEWRVKNGYGLWHPDDAQGHAPIATAGPRYVRIAREARVYRVAVAG